jgi:hypothetical protein
MNHHVTKRCVGFFFWAVLSVHPVFAETIARCGGGWLERIDGHLVLHVKGTPYEMGYQHGALLKDHCHENMNYLLKEKARELIKLGPLGLNPRLIVDGIVELQRPFVPRRYFEELEGLAAGAGLPPQDVRAGNFIPELFHCSGFAVMNTATKDGTLYHGRVLDYKCDWRLQEHAVLVVAEPAGRIPSVNVTYAGFIGSVTGMNAQQISIGEMGGFGLGHWTGVPMALLVREVLETAESLEDAIGVFKNNRRTCEYFYVIADGQSNAAVGLAANWEKVVTVQPGEAHRRLPHPVRDAVLLSSGARYEQLVARTQQRHGQIDQETALRLMDRPVAMNSNLHNVLFAPASTRLWVAHASIDGRPAAEQPYQAFQLTELLQRQPDPAAQRLPVAAAKRVAVAEEKVESH